MNIHLRRKSGCEISIKHYKNICNGGKFYIQIVEKLPGNNYKIGMKDEDMLEYNCLKLEDHWIKT